VFGDLGGVRKGGDWIRLCSAEKNQVQEMSKRHWRILLTGERPKITRTGGEIPYRGSENMEA